MNKKLGKLTLIVGLAIGSLSLSNIAQASHHCYKHHHCACMSKCCHKACLTYGMRCDWTPALWSQGYPYPGHQECTRGIINTQPPVNCVWVSTHKHGRCGVSGYKVCTY